jgi:hypothetical protein
LLLDSLVLINYYYFFSTERDAILQSPDIPTNQEKSKRAKQRAARENHRLDVSAHKLCNPPSSVAIAHVTKQKEGIASK